MTQVSGDITSGEMTFGRLERLPNRVLKQQRRRRLRKRQLKSSRIRAASIFIALYIPFRLLRQMLANVFGVEF